MFYDKYVRNYCSPKKASGITSIKVELLLSCTPVTSITERLKTQGYTSLPDRPSFQMRQQCFRRYCCTKAFAERLTVSRIANPISKPEPQKKTMRRKSQNLYVRTGWYSKPKNLLLSVQAQ